MYNKKYGFGPFLAIIPAFIIFFVFTILVSVSNFGISFTDFNGTFRVPVNFVGLSNYRIVLSANTFGREVLQAIKVSFIYAISITLISNFISIVLAVLCNLKLRLRNFYRAVIFLPVMLGTVVVGIAWRLIFDPYSGPVNGLFKLFGKSSAILGDPGTALYYLIFVTIWGTFGYTFVIYLAGLQSVPKELYEAGQIDGTGAIGQFLHITVPLIWPVITVNVLITLIGTLRNFDFITAMTGGGPAGTTTTLSIHIFNNLAQSGISQGFVSSLSVILFFIIGIVVSITLLYMTRGRRGNDEV